MIPNRPRTRRLAAAAALVLAGLGLGGCIVYPAPYYHHGYYRSYYGY